MSKILSGLNSFLNDQLKFGENQNIDLATVEDGVYNPYGSLASKVGSLDTSEERSYSEKGYLEYDSFSVLPQKTQTHWQEPSYTIFVKKSMFSSLSDSFALNYLDESEKLFYKSVKTLFQNKCKTIAAYERLTKAAAIVDLTGKVDADLFGIISGSIDILSSFFPENDTIGSLKATTDKIKKLTIYNKPATFTNWVTDDTPLSSVIGSGTGVLELTNVKSFSTTISVSQDGSGNLSISDPYNFNMITLNDIEKAISDAGNAFYNNRFLSTLNNVSNDAMNADMSKLDFLRSTRGVGKITFKTNANTVFGKRLTIINDRLGVEIPFEVNAIGDNGIISNFIVFKTQTSVLGEEGIQQDEELALVNKIIKDMFNKMSYETLTKSASNFGPRAGNEDTPINYVRKKMMFWFLTRNIIDVNDVVHIYVNSKHQVDSKISSLRDNFNKLTIVQSVSNNVANIKESFNQIAGIFGAGGTNYEIEKAVFAGPDFPNVLWTMLREQFVTEKTGVSIFCGLVTNSNVQYSNGIYTTNVNLTDNKKYLSFGLVNSQPSVDVFNGSLYDVLTPFKSKFDSNVFSKDYKPTDLLDENKALLTKNENQIKIKAGPLAGRPANFENLFGDVYVDKQGRVNRAFYAPDGLVYRHKEGIGVLTQFGKFDDLAEPARVGAPNIASNPFAGQDVMNTLSLLISGVPYNYATYLKGIKGYNTSQTDKLGNTVAGSSFFDKFRTDLRKVNRMYGNFVPFKNYTSNEQTYRNLLLKQSITETANEKVNEIMLEVSKLSAELRVAGSNTGGDGTTRVGVLKDRLSTLTNNANNILSEANAAAQKVQVPSSVLDVDDVSSMDPLNSEKARKNIKRKSNFLTRRMSYNVRANEDTNYLIIDDSYDKDYDIAAFENGIAKNIEPFNSEYLDIKEKVNSVASLLELECFANSQGHIVIRPPQYNKIPSSVFYRMMELKSKTGIRIFPKFLEDLFGLQIETVSSKIESLEDRIRIVCSFLNTNFSSVTNDFEAAAFIQSNSTVNIAKKRSDFQFLTDSNGMLSNIEAIKKIRSIDDLKNNTGFDDIQKQTYTSNELGTQPKLSILTYLSGDKNPIAPRPIDGTYGGSAIERLRNRGEEFSIQEYTNSIGQGTISTNLLDVYKTLSSLDNLLKEREKMVKVLHFSLKNLVEANTVDGEDLQDSIFSFAPNKYVPELYSGLIEDESYDDLGPGSGQRYIISDDKIKSFSINYVEPQFTSVTVSGILGDFIGQGDFNAGQFQGGNSLVSATAIDFDMLRRFGSRKTNSINLPFFTNPETQCAPYAVSLLNKVRKNLINANISLVANEYYQVGDVVYLESQNKLFYVDSVSHNYSEGSSYSTELTLTYGHSPGEYIPTILDVVGKLLYKNRDNQTFINFRQQQTDSYKPYGVFVLEGSNTFSNLNDPGQSKVGFAKNNSQLITDLLFDASLMIEKYKVGNTKMKVSVEIRAYGKEEEGNNTIALQAAENFKSLLVAGFNGGPPMSLSDIDVVSVLLGPSESRSPTQKAMSINHDLYLNAKTNNLLDHLYKQILDVLIKFEEI